jgi:tetratricopeptide (TPR) repeat protein
MTNNPTDIWAWTYKDKQRLHEEGGVKQALAENYEKFWNYFHNDNVSAELAINDALDTARATGELRWELHLRHWRLQLWLTQDRIKEMQPEAIDLLSLAVDERVKDVPQRICAYHDIVECYVQMDPAGYYEDIKENAKHILNQLPQKHPCADCARANLARTAAASGRLQEAKHWLAEHEANRNERAHPGLLNGRGRTYALLQQWEEAEHYYQEACKVSRKEEQYTSYLEALIGVARARVAQGKLGEAQETVQQIRRSIKYEGETNLMAFLLEVEGYLAESHRVPHAAIGYFTHAAKLHNELGRYRDAAEFALYAAELAREQQLSEPEEALEIAVRATGMLPPASQDVYQRLATFGRKPLPPELVQKQEQVHASADQLKASEERKELVSIEEVLQAHLQSGNFHGITTTLFRLGVWHDGHNHARAAVDYFLWGAVLERLERYSGEEREDSLNALKHMSNKLPEGAVTRALRAAESAQPTHLIPMLTQLPLEQWRWTVQAMATEIAGKPVVEPEPANKHGQARFEQWVSHCSSMTALVVRFRERADPAKCEDWAVSLEESAQEMEEHLGEHRNEPEALVVPTFARSLAALSRGDSFEAIGQHILPPFDQVIRQIEQVAKEPVWRHPDSSPIDFLVEHAAQKAVRALRHHDAHRASRLANLTFRYELMLIDLRQHEQLLGIARFLEALITLLQHDGQQLPRPEPPLEEPYGAILAAVYQEGQPKLEEEED